MHILVEEPSSLKCHQLLCRPGAAATSLQNSAEGAGESPSKLDNSSLVGRAAVVLQDAGLEKEGGRVCTSARQLAAVPGAAGASEVVATRHSSMQV